MASSMLSNWMRGRYTRQWDWPLIVSAAVNTWLTTPKGMHEFTVEPREPSTQHRLTRNMFDAWLRRPGGPLADVARKGSLKEILGDVGLFWTALRRCWSRWADVLILVKPDTVIGWHRSGFRLYWRWRSRPLGGRPKITPQRITVAPGLADGRRPRDHSRRARRRRPGRREHQRIGRGEVHAIENIEKFRPELRPHLPGNRRDLGDREVGSCQTRPCQNIASHVAILRTSAPTKFT
jgi:hypothetical protein